MDTRLFHCRRFEMSDVDGIVELFKKVFSGSFSRKWWEGKYLLNPAGFRGEEGDVWIAETDDGRLVGHWGVIPEKLKLGSNTVVAAQAVDAATHPDYQGQGIFKTLVRNVCLEATKRYDFVFGYPNELYRGYEKLGWKSHRISEFLNFLNYEQAMKNYFHNDIVLGITKVALRTLRVWNTITSGHPSEKVAGSRSEIEEVSEFPEEIDDFWKLSRKEHEITIERDRRFLVWRFSEQFGSYRIFLARSSDDDRIVGYVVVRRTSIRGIPGILDIVDLQVLPNEDQTLMDLIVFTVELAKKENLNVVHCRVPPWHKCAVFLRRLAFVPLGSAFELAKLYQPRLIIYPPTQEETIDTNRWFYTLADTDYA